MDKAGVLADPTKAGALGQPSFEDWAGVGVAVIENGVSGLLFDEVNQRL